MSNQYTMIFQDEIKQIRVLNSSGKHLFIALCLHTKVEIKEEEGKQYRIRKCFPSYAYLMKITGCSRGYIGKGIANLKEHGFLSSQQRAGTSAVFTIKTEVYTVETSHTVETSEVYTVETTEVHTVETSENSTVCEHIKNKDQKELSKNINILILSDKQKEIINKYCSYFGWRGDYIEELQKTLPVSCSEYLTDELILIGAYNLKRINEGQTAWTGNYIVKGIVRWIEGGKGRSSKPNVRTARFVEEVHSKILKWKKEKEIQPISKKKEISKEGQEDFDWLLDHTIKQYQRHPSGLNKDQLINLTESIYCHDLNKQKIKSVIGG